MTATRRLRGAFRLVDLLAAIVLVVVVIGLMWPTSCHVGVYGDRTQCINNLKQLGLALHIYAGSHQSALPPLTCDLAKPKHGAYNGGVFVTLLPFLEQEVLFDSGAGRLPHCPWAAPIPPNTMPPFAATPTATSPRPLYNVPFKFYICPADATVTNQNSGNQNATNLGTAPYYFPWAAASYAANYQVFGVDNNFSDATKSGNFAGPQYNIGNVPDGNSNTVFFGEVFAACTRTAGSLWAYPGIANYSGVEYGNPAFPEVDSDPTSPTYGGYNPAGGNGLGDTADRTASYLWAPVFANSHQTYGFPQEALGAAKVESPPLSHWDLPPQTGITPDRCDKARLQAFHTAAVVVGMGDGSARLVNGATSVATWHAALVPDDGVPLGSDW